ncbi:lantibiotic dehydratase [Lentzea pudingi]|uniref:Lantibiotic dehydratase n=1 Tax=Lentzea pudingi TaxID=1789439 RepID=A0ABQ2HBV4_9PSEU|nr:lantibiotic dehydratase [Lentzea pudingi]GGM73524.1 lantibiotic dehydratase [Lentzea pudingi]
MSTTDWTLLPSLVLRSAGFPWQTVESLRYGGGAAALVTVAGLRAAALDHAEGLRPNARLSRGQQSRLKGLRGLEPHPALPDAWLAGWNRLTEALADAQAAFVSAVDQDIEDVAEAFAALRADERFLDAVVCSSPAAYRDLERGAKGARIRRQLASYAQRLAAKSETMSFFGPINYAELTTDPGPSALGWDGHQEIRERQAHTAARILDSLQGRILGDDRVFDRLVPRRKTVLRRATGVIADVDGTRTVAEYGPAAREEIRAAIVSGRLTHDLVPPATEVDPWRWLAHRIGTRADQPGTSEIDVLVKTVRAALAEYPAAPPSRKVALQGEIANLLPARAVSGGRFYNDRVVVHEAAAGTVRATLSGGLAADLRTVVPGALDLLAWEAEATRRATNRALASLLGACRTSLGAALKLAADLEVRPGGELAAAVAETVAKAGTESIDLADHIAPARTPRDAVLCSVDLLPVVDDLARYREGETLLVLGDIHDAALLTPWAMQFHPEAADRIARRDAEIRRVLRQRATVTVVSGRSTGLPPLEYPGLVLELGGTAANPDLPRIGLDDLYVESDGTEAFLRSRRHPGVDLLFHNGELDTGLHTALALPRIRRPQLPDLPHVPRLTWRNVVLSRRCWTVDSAAVPRASAKQTDADRLWAVAEWIAETGLPARFFAKSPAERKPIFVDTATPALLDGLTRLAGTADRLRISEVLPEPEQAWLRDGRLRFAAELRSVYLRPGGDPA